MKHIKNILKFIFYMFLCLLIPVTCARFFGLDKIDHRETHNRETPVLAIIKDSARVVVVNNRIAIKKFPHLTEDNIWIQPGETIEVQGYDPESKFYPILYRGQQRFIFYSMLQQAEAKALK
ncbi:hypothetical protein QNI19_21590 [Cytophagaceae bacterium DM2B3-1]|uniref:Uncharacterized protein n=1 Tax=Xanthocytophaga flava TaxID=3048013 RepID=A0ABT7CPT9_9BACT|nr:hypothetical protein [Xanthocytophaga flavus]MDJ1495546.1 hypothetical protein [Xanthocytophaga flavus]